MSDWLKSVLKSLGRFWSAEALIWAISSILIAVLIGVGVRKRDSIHLAIINPSRAPVLWLLAFGLVLGLGYVPGADKKLCAVAWYPGGEGSTGLLLGILTGLGAVILAIAIFLAGQFRFGHSSSSGRALVLHSGAFPVTLASVGALIVILLHGEATVVDASVVLALGVGVTAVVYRFFRALLDPGVAWEVRLQLLRQRARVATSDLVVLRQREASFAKWIQEHDGSIDYTPFLTTADEATLTLVSAPREGVVGEIRKSPLEHLLEFIEKDSESAANEASSDGEAGVIEQFGLRRRTSRVYVLVRPGQHIREGDTIGAARLTSGANQNAARRVTSLITDAVDLQGVRRTEAYYFKKDVQELEEEFHSAIENERPTGLEQATQQYFVIVDTFLDVLREAGVRGSLGARGLEHIQERPEGELVGDEFHRLCRHVLEAGLQATKPSIHREVSGIPAGTMYRAIQADNHGMAAEYAGYHEALLDYALRGTGETGERLFDRSWRPLRGFLDGTLTSRLETADDERLEELERLFVACLSVVGKMLKRCIDSGQFSRFKTILTRFGSLQVEGKASELRIQYLRRRSGESEEPQTTLAASIFRLEQASREVRAGVAAWVLFRRERSDVSADWDNWLKAALSALPENEDDLTSCLIEAMTYDKTHSWGWDDWELAERESGGMRALGVEGRLTRVFVLSILQRVQESTTGSEAPLRTGPGRDFPLTVEHESSDLNKFISEVEESPEEWAGVIDGNLAGKIEVLRARLARTIEDYRRREEEEIALRNIDQEVVNQVISTSLRERDRVSVSRSVWGPLDDTAFPEETMERRDAGLSLGQIVPKDAFFADWYRSYTGLGEGFGRAMAHGEDRVVFSKLLESIGGELSYSGLEGLLSAIEGWIQSEGAAKRWVILAAGNFASDLEFRQHKAVTPGWKLPRETTSRARTPDAALSVAGIEIPVYETPASEEAAALLLCPKDAGRLSTVRPVPGETYAGAVAQGGVLFWVRDLNSDDELRQEILEQLPHWLESLPEERRESHLRRQALFELREKFSFEPSSEPNGVRLVG